VRASAFFAKSEKPTLLEGVCMKLSTGQLVSAVIALAIAVVLIIDPPFVAAATGAATASQVVYGSLFDPPIIADATGKLDLPLLLLELAFVVFIGGALFLVASQENKDR
jgi:hypothetical protein